MRRFTSPPLFPAGRGFTLIELLVVIAIIAVLALILIPILGYMREQSDSTTCTNNLRQLGIGINDYATDHDGRLPGPLQPLVYPPDAKDKTAESGSLVALIGPYIGIQKQANIGGDTRTAPSVTTCPSFKRAVKDKAAPSFVLNFADRMEDLDNQPPWGNIKGGSEPVRMASLGAWVDARTDPRLVSPNGQMNLAQTWAIKDADKQAFRKIPSPGGIEALPEKPSHGKYRNALFYDWHVGRLDLEDKAL